MTIINSFTQGQNAYLLTDTSWLDNETGIILGTCRKIVVGKRFPWAIAVTGDAHVEELTNQINHLDPLDAEDLALSLPQLLRGLKALSFDPSFTMALRLAAWSEAFGCPRVFHIDTDAHRAAQFGCEPWELLEAHVLIPGERSAPHIRHLVSPIERISDPGLFDPESDGLSVIAAQRLHERYPAKCGKEPIALVGCSAELCRVSPDGVEIKTIYEWPDDRAGGRIQPKGGENVLAEAL